MAGEDPLAAWRVGSASATAKGDPFSAWRVPASAEDFTPKASQPEGSAVGRFLSNLGESLNPLTLISGAAQAIAHPIDTATALVGSQVDEIKKAKALYDEGRYEEAAGHAAAGILPVIGPAAARSGEQIAGGDIAGGLGSATGLLAPVAGGRAAGRGLATVGEQIAAKAGPTLTEAAKLGALELGAHAVGVPPGVISAVRVGSKAVKALKAAQEAAPVATEAAEETAPVVSPNAGGRLVPRTEPTLHDVLSQVLDEVQASKSPANVTLPPAAELPPGYTPRTTVPKRMVKAAPPPPNTAAPEAATPPRPYFLKSPQQLADEAAAPPSSGPRPYFLKSPEQMAADAPQAATGATSGSLTINDLPMAWRSRVGQDIFPTTGAESKEVMDAMRQELKDRGLTIGQAITEVSKNKNISTQLRSQLLRSLSTMSARQ